MYSKVDLNNTSNSGEQILMYLMVKNKFFHYSIELPTKMIKIFLFASNASSEAHGIQILLNLLNK